MPATEKTEKTEKASNKSPKVFDISKPGKSTAAATARPVIVSNRPIMQDPMVAPSAPSAPDLPNSSSATSVKVNIKPLSEPVEDSNAPEAEAAKNEAAKPDEPTEPSESVETVETSAEPVANEKAEESKAADQVEPAPEETKPAEKTAVPDDAPSPDTAGLDQTKDEKAAAELEAAAKQEEEIHKLVESKEYFLPINSVEKRRSKITGTVGFVVIVLLALLLINIMLDVGTLTIPGVKPLTNLFGA